MAEVFSPAVKIFAIGRVEHRALAIDDLWRCV
jgi:hypothetical protein